MSELLLHAKTKAQVDAFLKKPSQTLMITGQAGSGKETLARWLASKLVTVPPEKLDDYPYLMTVSKPTDKQEIPIESIRQVIRELKLKPAIAAGGQAQKIVLINGAHQLSEEAQNALLKVIEEPPANTVFILTVPSESDVLPTITSRSRLVKITPVDLDDSKQFFSKNSAKTVESAWSLSQGAAGMISAILADDVDHPLKKAVDSAKELLKMGRYERVIYLDGISGDKAELNNLLDALSRVLSSLQWTAVSHSRDSQSRKLTESRRQVNTALKQLKSNASPRLICLNLAVNLPI